MCLFGIKRDEIMNSVIPIFFPLVQTVMKEAELKNMLSYLKQSSLNFYG